MRFYFVDRVSELTPGVSIRGYKQVAMEAGYFDTHFPRYPVFPGVLIVEAMAQLAGLLLECSPPAPGDAAPPPGEERKALLSIVDRVKFKRLVRPGDRLELAARLGVRDEDGARAEVEARVDGELVAATRLTFALLPVPPQFAATVREERAALLLALQAPVAAK